MIDDLTRRLWAYLAHPDGNVRQQRLDELSGPFEDDDDPPPAKAVAS